MTVLRVDVPAVACFCPGFKILPQAYIHLESDQDLKRDKVQRLCRSFIIRSALDATFLKSRDFLKLQIYMITTVDFKSLFESKPLKKQPRFYALYECSHMLFIALKLS